MQLDGIRCDLAVVGIGFATDIGRWGSHLLDGKQVHGVLADAVDGFFEVLLGPDAAYRFFEEVDALFLADEAGVVFDAEDAALVFLADEEDVGQAFLKLGAGVVDDVESLLAGVGLGVEIEAEIKLLAALVEELAHVWGIGDEAVGGLAEKRRRLAGLADCFGWILGVGRARERETERDQCKISFHDLVSIPSLSRKLERHCPAIIIEARRRRLVVLVRFAAFNLGTTRKRQQALCWTDAAKTLLPVCVADCNGRRADLRGAGRRAGKTPIPILSNRIGERCCGDDAGWLYADGRREGFG